MRENGLAVEASHDQAFDQATSFSLLLEHGLTIFSLLLRELTSTFDATVRNVEIV